jgi:hypothetical protein
VARERSGGVAVHVHGQVAAVGQLPDGSGGDPPQLRRVGGVPADAGPVLGDVEGGLPSDGGGQVFQTVDGDVEGDVEGDVDPVPTGDGAREGDGVQGEVLTVDDPDR